MLWNKFNWGNIRLLIAIIMAAFMLQGCGCARIDAGHTGIKVNLYGSDKGVDDVREVTGMVWYNAFTTSVFEWPLYVQNSVYTADKREGSETNQQLVVTTKDGMPVSFDVSINWRVDETKVTQVFVKYRKDLDEISETVMRNFVRKGYNNTAGNYTADSLYSQRIVYMKQAEKLIKDILEPEGFIVEQITLIGSLRLPAAIIKNINDKIAATQIAITKQKELIQVQADAKKAIARAQGDSAAMVINAMGKAKANTVINKSLTKNLVQVQWIEKWNGVKSHVDASGGGSGFILDLKK